MTERFKTTGVGTGSDTRVSNWKSFRDNMDEIKKNSLKKKKLTSRVKTRKMSSKLKTRTKNESTKENP